MYILTAEQAAFFAKVAGLVFLNPFGLEREKADWEVLGLAPEGLGFADRLQLIEAKLDREFKALERQAVFDIRHYQGKTEENLRLAWLFYVFHRYRQRFNGHINAQKQAGDKAIELAFARELMGEFEQAGFNPPETAHYIALLFQVQRAFTFIDETVSGDCPALYELRMRLWNNIFTFNPAWYLNYLCGRMEDFSLLLLGETGTGKSLVAKAVGCSGYIPFDLAAWRFVESFSASFKAINLSEYATGLLESELFGHKKGAFTGAIDNHPGLFAKCSKHGSVFIDEIGDIDATIQVKLLNVIQERVYSPVGSHEKHRFEGRVISATNRPIGQLLEQGLFRADLYYRLCSDVIILPSLSQRIRENPNELPGLIARLLRRVIPTPDDGLVAHIESKIRATVPADYPWPGNVRELEQCVRRICLTGTYQATPLAAAVSAAEAGFRAADGGYLSAQQLMQNYCRFLYGQLDSFEAVARIAGLDRRTVKKYMESDG
ncbi:sigma-54-dependent transcriptional regulator [Methylovulum psychrotolerans]|uniref:Fis family transcriptional regulator n=1 Tax=Methylovulum psychrotolerans TaxID=1704499 RepID=A0A1Z4BZZ8_9GAMM|nr:sigma 54-interacting transcriptional regulator [Methylovulum psychrotolerans]ASF46858.1 Fis family transcriptional regulator [Methylovulum psychrotolerans]